MANNASQDNAQPMENDAKTAMNYITLKELEHASREGTAWTKKLATAPLAPRNSS